MTILLAVEAFAIGMAGALTMFIGICLLPEISDFFSQFKTPKK
jgi:hypothetical protein